MDRREIGHRRLLAQHLLGPPLPDPAAVVRHLGAVQAQEYPYALWGLAQRTAGADDAAVRALVDDGAILRTHALRPTWHFVAPEDLGWIQALTAPRVHVLSGYHYRRLGIDAEVTVHTDKLITGALRGGNHLTRAELAAVLAAGGFPAAGGLLAYLVMHAELEGLIANGPMRAKQHTYALVEERVPAPRELAGDAALAELTLRFFATHGPATVKDFGWWSSLTVRQVRHGLHLVDSLLSAAEVDGVTLWFDPSAPTGATADSTALLLQGYDEYVVAYSDTKFAFNLAGRSPDRDRRSVNTTLHPVVVGGQLVGYWRRVPRGAGIVVEVDLLAELTPVQRKGLASELARFEAFAGVPISVVEVPA